jgi:hypothetical protein
MVFDGRYIADEPTFKRYAYAALKSRFADEAAFEAFYASLGTPQLKDELLLRFICSSRNRESGT